MQDQDELMCSSALALRICPVDGCTSIPLKRLEQHLTSVHPTLTAAETAQLLRTAAIFRVPAGKKRKDVVVRMGGKRRKLQLAKKSCGGICRHRAARPAADDVVQGVGLTQLPGMADKSVQCNLLPPGFLEKAEGTDSQEICRAKRPQYAKKSTCTSPISVLRRTAAAGALNTPEQRCPQRVEETEQQRRNAAGQPCEIMCKWGNWDVIFYETPPTSLSCSAIKCACAWIHALKNGSSLQTLFLVLLPSENRLQV